MLEPIEMLPERRNAEKESIWQLLLPNARKKETGAIQDLSVIKSRPGKEERNRCDTRPSRRHTAARARLGKELKYNTSLQ